MPQSAEFPDANAASLDAWNTNAAFWDSAQGDEGSHWQRELVFPPTLELLEPLPERILEIACGNGNFARTLARRGARVTATDGSGALLELARSRSGALAEQIRWQRVDATSAQQLAGIPGGPFGAAVCNMALMDIAALGPLFRTLPQLLEPRAPFVFSVLHPAFNQGSDTTLFVERRESPDGSFSTERGVRISRYLSCTSEPGAAIAGQPRLQPYFRRPLESLLGAAFECGWALDALREPSLAAAAEPASAVRLRWDDLPEIPPVLIARLRRLS